MDFRECVRTRFIEQILKPCQSKYGFTVLVVDDRTLSIVSSLFRMPELVDYNVPSVEQLSKARQPMVCEAIYFVEASVQNAKRMGQDFRDSKNPTYRGAHLFTVSTCGEEFMTAIKSEIPLVRALKTFKESHIGLLVSESNVFSTNHLEFADMLAGTSQKPPTEKTISRISDDIVSFYASIGRVPQIFYYRTSLISERVSHSLKQKLEILQKDLPDHVRSSDCDKIVILERSVDSVTPLLHDCHLQAMAHDLLNIIKNTYTYKKRNGIAAEAILDDADEVWRSLKYLHIADAMIKLPQKIREHAKTLPHAKNTAEGANQDEMKNILSHMILSGPMNAKFEANTFLCEDCYREFKERNLSEICRLEQNVATGFDERGVKTIDPQRLLFSIIQNSGKMEDKMRALLIYCFTQSSKITQENLNLLLESSEMLHKRNCIMNFEKIKVSFLKDSPSSPLESLHRRQTKGPDGETYATSRYVPAISEIIEDFSEGTPKQFICVDSTALEPKLTVPNSAKSCSDVTSFGHYTSQSGSDFSFGKYQATSSSRLSSSKNILIFIIGGISYAEMRCVNEYNKKFQNFDIFLGGTEILTPETFLERVSSI